MRKAIGIGGFAGALACATVMATAPSISAQPLVTGGLVNVTVTDVIDGDVLSNNNTSLGLALGVAANVCDVNVNLLAKQLRNGGATCTNDLSGQRVDITQIA